MAVCYLKSENVNDIIRESLVVFDGDIKEKAIDIKMELLDTPPPMISTDRKLLKRALCSIIKNALEAMTGSIKVLKITSRITEDHVVLEMSDTGKGISKDKLKNIFDPFVTSKVYGPGLGLTFANKIIQDHGGNIDVESEPDKGTTFTITLPLKES
jgi:signal transduction histidine kinase